MTGLRISASNVGSRCRGPSASQPVPSERWTTENSEVGWNAPGGVTADRLNADKEKNEVAWNDIYLDKQAQISGDISAIADAGGYYDVKLRSGNPFMDVVCKINKSETSEALVTRLSAGQSVTILGRATDDGIIDIVIKDCSILLDGQVVALPDPDSAAEPAIADISAPSTAG